MRRFPAIIVLLIGLALSGLPADKARAENYPHYVLMSDDFSPVPKLNAQALAKRWDRWVLLPVRHHWTQPYADDFVAKLKRAGFNGGVCDFIPRNDADLHEKHGLLWYLSHAAGTGDLRLADTWNVPRFRAAPRRPKCLLDPDVLNRLQGRLGRSVRLCMRYSTRIAYALDDEISWSTTTDPCRWDNHPLSTHGFREWLLKRYGSRGATLRQWGRDGDPFLRRMATPDDFQDLYRRPLMLWNLAPWCDALSYMDSQLLNLTGDLVSYAAEIDPSTPCGIVGAEAPAAYGGYNYAKLMNKVQFLGLHDVGSAMEIARSLNTSIGMPLITAGASDPKDPDGVWWNWYGLAHGFRGTTVLAEEWFGSDRDILHLAPGIRKIADVSRKVIGSKWQHDGVAIYYSHPSIQISWFMDCQVHGRRWIKRLGSVNHRLASTYAAFLAWTRLLEDARLQYNFVSYADVVAKGLIPNGYKVLILPRVLALSDVEVEAITRYVEQGGVVIADHMVGLFDQHGRGRRVPAFDALLGLTKHPPVVAGNVFGGVYLTEFDAESFWNGKFYRAASDIWPRCLRARGLPVAERQIGQFIAGRHGNGWAMLMNVSLAEYCLHRLRRSPEAVEIRKTVVSMLERAGVRRWLTLRVNGKDPPDTEATYWKRGGRRVVCVVRNPLRLGGIEGPDKPTGPRPGGARDGAQQRVVRLTIQMTQDQTNVIDEIAGRPLGDGRTFTVDWKSDEAAVLSMAARSSGSTTQPAASQKEK